nr:hypothetical protein [Tanacetum cinerariifolium]
MFTTIKLVSKHQKTQQFGAMLPIELTNADIKNSDAYKEYYAVATGATPPKIKASIRKTRSSFDTTVTPPTAAEDPRLGIFINQSKYALKSLKKYGFESCDLVDTPTVEKSKLDEDKEGKAVDLSHYCGMIGTLLYLIASRPDLQFAICKCVRYQARPTEKHVHAVKRIFRYLHGTVNQGLWYPKDSSVALTAFADADHAGCQDTRRSTSAEYIALSECCAQILWIRSQLMDYGLGFNKITMYFDNKSAIALCCNNVQHSRSNHIDIRYHFIKEHVENGVIELYFINTEYQLVDLFTKALGRDRIEFLINKLCMRSFTPETLKELTDESSSVPSQFVTSMLNPTPDAGIESIFETTSKMDVHTPTSVAPFPVSAPTLTPSTIATITTTQQVPTHPTTAPSTLIQDLPNFGSLFGFDHRQKTLEANFSEFTQTNQFVGAVSSILGIVHRYMDQRMNEAIKVSVQLQSDRLRDEAQKENDEFLKTIDENMQKIIKEQVKEQVKVQVSKILPKIEQTVNEQLEAEVLTQSSNSSKTSYAIAADLSEMELKKILIEKMEGNKVTLKRLHDDDADKDKEPYVGSDRGSKRRREGKEPESASTLKKKATKSDGKSTQGYSRGLLHFSNESLKVDTLTLKLLAGPAYELMKGSCKSLVELEFFLEEVYKATTYQLDWVNPEGQQYPHNLLKPLPLISNSQGRRVIPFDHFISNDLEYLRGGALSRKYTPSVTKTKAADYGHIKWIKDLVPRKMWIQEPVGYDKHALWGISHWGSKRQQFYGFVVNREFARDVYSKRRIIAVTELKIVECHNYKHLDWIMVHRDDDKLYKFKEGDFKRLCIQDIEDMLLLLVQGKLTNLTVKELFAFDVSLQMFTRSIVIQRRVEDLQLGVESYQKKLNLTKPDTYRSDLNDGTLIDVCTALDDRLKGIRMKYLPQLIWRKNDRDRAVAMIQAIDKMLKTRRIMRSLKRSKRENMGKVPTEIELILEHTQQGISHEVSVNPYGFVGNLKMEVKVPGSNCLIDS